MTLESLVDAYGYAAVAIGTFLEGETILVLAGFAAARGYLSLPWVVLAAFFGSLCGDQLFFYLGRRHSRAMLARRPSWKARADRMQGLLDRFRTPLILIFRFLYGLRTVAPFVIGMSSVPVLEFVLLNAVGALVWAAAVGAGGYLFGSALEVFIRDMKHYEMEVIGLIAALGAVVWLAHFFRKK